MVCYTIVNSYGTMELWFTMEKLWYYRKNYGTYRELWKFDLRREKSWKIIKKEEN